MTNAKPVVVSSPMSLTGATRRIVRRWPRPASLWAAALMRGLALPVTLLIVWVLLLSWLVLACGVFGVFVIPWRLHRRAERRKLATLQQIERNSGR